MGGPMCWEAPCWGKFELRSECLDLILRRCGLREYYYFDSGRGTAAALSEEAAEKLKEIEEKWKKGLLGDREAFEAAADTPGVLWIDDDGCGGFNESDDVPEEKWECVYEVLEELKLL